MTPEEILFRACEAFSKSRHEAGDGRFPGLAEEFAEALPGMVDAARQSIRMRDIGHELAYHDAVLGEDA